MVVLLIKMSAEETPTDFLEVDDTLPGQNYVCLSFLSPESMIQKKDAFYLSKFLQSYCKDLDLKYEEIYSKYEDFTYKYGDKLQRDFDENNKFQTSMRGLKVRGTYSTKEEATARAKKLQTMDSNFHVFVGEVGKWLPWDPTADEIQDEVFQNSQLNDMMEKYQENNVNRDIFYEEQKRDKIKAAREEVLKKKREEQAKKAEEMTALEDVKEGVADVVSGVSEVEQGVEEIKEGVQEAESEVIETVHKLDEDVKESLETVDPWLANKMKASPEPEVEPEPEPEVEPEPVEDC